VARLERSQSISSNAPPLRQGEQNDLGEDERGESHEEEQPQQTASSPGDTRESSPRRGPANRDSTELTNPLLESPSKFMSSSSGRSCEYLSTFRRELRVTFGSVYLGTSSNWSFHGQILSLVHEHIRRTPLPSAELLFDGSAYDLPWDGTRSLPESSTPVIPSIDYAIFLINAVKFHCAQLVHVFDEDEFMANLHAFYSSPDNRTWKESLWYIHFLLIIAFGKTFMQHKQHAPSPPGADFFVHALQLLPDTSRLCTEPVIAAEILCCIALHLQALDSRNAAHVTVRLCSLSLAYVSCG
jgi:proline utilization trans-activator